MLVQMSYLDFDTPDPHIGLNLLNLNWTEKHFFSPSINWFSRMEYLERDYGYPRLVPTRYFQAQFMTGAAKSCNRKDSQDPA
jgi:hypothetical protein